MPIKVATKTVSKVRKPRVTAKANVAGPKQKAPKTPPKSKDIKARTSKAKSMVKRGSKGAALNKSLGLVNKPKLAGFTGRLRK